VELTHHDAEFMCVFVGDVTSADAELTLTGFKDIFLEEWI